MENGSERSRTDQCGLPPGLSPLRGLHAHGGLVLFAFTTILGWNYYGERCMEYLVGVKGIMPYRVGFILLVGCGALLKLESIWILADIVNALWPSPT